MKDSKSKLRWLCLAAPRWNFDLVVSAMWKSPGGVFLLMGRVVNGGLERSKPEVSFAKLQEDGSAQKYHIGLRAIGQLPLFGLVYLNNHVKLNCIPAYHG